MGLVIGVFAAFVVLLVGALVGLLYPDVGVPSALAGSALSAVTLFLVFWVLAERFGLPGSLKWSAQKQTEREHARLCKAPLATLIAETRTWCAGELWAPFPAAQRIMSDDIPDDRTLLELLLQLHREGAEEDLRRQADARSSRSFQFADCPLGPITDALQARVATPA